MTTLRNPDLKDVLLEEKISRAIEDGEKSSKVMNVVKNGYVHLVGYVEGSDVKKKIESLVEVVPGVRTVTNHIRIKYWDENIAVTHF